MKKATGFYPRIHVDAAGSGVVSQAGGVTLIEAVRVSGIDRGLSVALEGWRKPTAVHNPAKVLVDLAVTLALVGIAWLMSRFCGPNLACMGRCRRIRRCRAPLTPWPRTPGGRLAAINTARAKARARVWGLAGPTPPLPASARTVR